MRADFEKTRPAGLADLFAAEVDGLEALRKAGVRVPAVISHGAEKDRAYIRLEKLDLKRGGDWAALGKMLAAQHRHTGERFGWQRDNYIGDTPQINSWRDDWATFFRECRIEPQLALAKRNGFDFSPGEIFQSVRSHRPKPSLLHGDLWSGNAGFTADGPVIFDPAVYYGDREADLAMTELFGGFPSGFYSSYLKEYPLDAGYEQRKHLYNLYHLLNHLNLFGGGYLLQVKATLRLLDAV